jgi:hypothetical protein
VPIAVSGFPPLEVLIGLSFVFFLLSTACSAIQEMLSSWLGWRAKTLEDAVGNLLGNPQVERGVREWFGRIDRVGVKDPKAKQAHAEKQVPADLTAEVFRHWRIRGLVRDPDSSLRRRSRPSYLPPRALSLAVAETLARHAEPADADTPTPWEHTDDKIFENVQKTLLRLPDGHRRELLQKAVTNADGELERFREHIETQFNDAMERASGWYKRKAQIVLAILAVLFAVGLNIDTVSIAKHLYNDEAVRNAVIAKVDSSPDPQSAATTVSKVNELNLPVGWGAANTPKDVAGWLGRIPGWLLTIAALNLGAPFWFDLLSKLSRQRQSGIADPPGRPTSDKAAVTGKKRREED